MSCDQLFTNLRDPGRNGLLIGQFLVKFRRLVKRKPSHARQEMVRRIGILPGIECS